MPIELRRVLFSLPWLLSLSSSGAEHPSVVCKPPCAQPLFVVQRSLNENELVYQANVTPLGLHPQVPLHAYWIMKTRGGRREELTNMERTRAYGITFLSIAPREARFSVKALEGVLFRAVVSSTEEGTRVTPFASVGGEEMSVDRVFITTKGGGLVPRVLFIEFSGISSATHAPVVHRIVPKGAHASEPAAGTEAHQSPPS